MQAFVRHPTEVPPEQSPGQVATLSIPLHTPSPQVGQAPQSSEQPVQPSEESQIPSPQTGAHRQSLQVRQSSPVSQMSLPQVCVPTLASTPASTLVVASTLEP